MYSMTGYGKAEYQKDGVELVVEMKSVNNRYLDISVRLPHVLAPYEERVRSIVKEKICRGRVDVFVSLCDKREKEKSFFVDLPLARAYVDAAKRLSEETGLTNDITVASLFRYGEIVKTEENSSADEIVVEALERAARGAADALKAMREKEGNNIKAELFHHMEEIERLRELIKERAPLVSENYREKLSSRVQEYLEGKADESRILTEAAVFADKCNIDEELERLSSHIKQFPSVCEEETAGRKLDFLVQEFNRECNTICSKSNDGALTSYALKMKNEIEKVREQIQNLE